MDKGKLWNRVADELINLPAFILLLGVLLVIVGASNSLSIGAFTLAVSQEQQPALMAFGGILMILGILGFVWRQVSSRLQKTTLIEGNEEKLYETNINRMKKRKFSVIRVYGPVGFRQTSEYKLRWLKELSNYLRKNENAEARLIFGVPYWKSAYEHMKETLTRCFEHCPNAAIRYFPPAVKREAPPLMGMLILDTYAVSLGLGIRETRGKVDTSWTIQDTRVAQTARDWFERAWATRQNYELKSPTISLAKGFENIEEKYASVFTESFCTSASGAQEELIIDSATDGARGKAADLQEVMCGSTWLHLGTRPSRIFHAQCPYILPVCFKNPERSEYIYVVVGTRVDDAGTDAARARIITEPDLATHNINTVTVRRARWYQLTSDKPLKSIKFGNGPRIEDFGMVEAEIHPIETWNKHPPVTVPSDRSHAYGLAITEQKGSSTWFVSIDDDQSTFNENLGCHFVEFVLPKGQQHNLSFGYKEGPWGIACAFFAF